MNLLVDSNGKVVKVERLYAHADGYFWPQCKISTEDLTQKMQWYVDNKKDIKKYKSSARKYAKQYLDWQQNSTELVEIFANVQISDKYDKKTMIDFEKKRQRHWTIKFYLKCKYILKVFKFIKKQI